MLPCVRGGKNMETQTKQIEMIPVKIESDGSKH